MNRSSLLSLALLSAASLAGCAATPPGAATAPCHGKCDGADDGAPTTTPIEVVQAGFFEDTDALRAVRLEYRLVLFRGDDEPTERGSVEIRYAHGRSLPVVVDVPDGAVGLLAFELVGEHDVTHAEHRSATQYVDLAAPAGAFALLPAWGDAAAPYDGECYHASVWNADNLAGATGFAGKVERVILGFTSASVEDYLAGADVPWENSSEEPVAEGILDAAYAPDAAGRPGDYLERTLPVWVRVPAGKHLVFKLGMHAYGGRCATPGDTVDRGTYETRTYFVR